MIKLFKKTNTQIIFLTILFSLVVPLVVSADDGGQRTSFFVNSSYDLQKRTELTATLIRITPSLYFYLDDSWWNSLSVDYQQEVRLALQGLGEEFGERIYPILTSAFGGEWNPGIDRDYHITVLFHPMPDGAGGYFNDGDEYSRQLSIFSNEREMVYLNSRYLTSPLIKSFLAHEFTHLITFNQKEQRNNVVEEVWLNELRAEYAPTLVGYDKDYYNSNLKQRLNIFVQFPNDSLTEWKGGKADYGVINLFSQYLVEHYGIKILTDSLFSKETGISSINKALLKNGFSEDFSQIFTDWTIANIVNDCHISEKYCYKNENLKTLKITPSINFLPLKGASTFASTQETKDWAGNWYKFIGGKGDLKLEFISFSDVVFKIPYVIKYLNGQKEVDFLTLGNQLIIRDFGEEILSLTIIPSLQNKISDFDGAEKSYPFFWSVSTQVQKDGNEEETSETESIQVLLEKIDFLEKELLVLKNNLRNILTGESSDITAAERLTQDLKYGIRGEEVVLLQTWLARDKSIYPEGLVTGFFGSLTESAVIRFQEKYAEDVLAFWELTKGTGFVGSTTRAKLNQLHEG